MLRQAVRELGRKGLLARRARLALTAVAVLIGVALVTGTLLLTDAAGRSVRRLTAGAQAVQRALVRYPGVTVTDPATYQRQRASHLDDLGGVPGLLTALVLLAAAVATLGIANTLALAVAERTREFGLLRAVGMTARQLAPLAAAGSGPEPDQEPDRPRQAGVSHHSPAVHPVRTDPSATGILRVPAHSPTSRAG